MRKEFRNLKKIKKKGSFLKNRFFLLGVGAAVCVELLFYSIVLFPFFQVQGIRVEGNKEVSENAIKSVALDHVWGKLLFFPTVSILLVDTQSMQDALLESIPELETVNIQRKFPNILVISLHERAAAALWCPAPELPKATRCRATLSRIVDGDSGSGCQELSCVAIDKEGVAFKAAVLSPENVIIQGQAQSLNVRETVVAKDVLDAILGFAKEVKRRSLLQGNEARVSSFSIVSESKIDATISEGWSMYFTPSQDLSWQITKLQTVLENKIPPEKRRKLEYVDVRFGDQAYIKYR